MGKRSAGTILVLAVLLGLLALAIYVGVVGWNMGADGTGESMSTSGYIAMGSASSSLWHSGPA